MMQQFVVWRVRGDSPYSTRRWLMSFEHRPEAGLGPLYGLYKLITTLED